MKQMINIKKLSPEHIDGVVAVENTCFCSPWSRQDLEKQLELETSHFSVAVIDDKVVGYMGLQIFSGGGYVTNIAVLPEYRRQGIARMLINEQMKNDMDFITLEVRESNIPAIKLYTEAGFKNAGIRPNFYSNPKENALIMTKVFS